MPDERPLTFPSRGRRLFGLLHTPAGPCHLRVVVCHPFFEELKSARRPLVETARALANEGCAVLRFDYGGCGDSDGAGETFDATGALEDALAAADVTARETDGAAPLAWLGLRAGALVALAAAARRPTAALMLWEPVKDGRSYIEQELRKKLVKEMVTFGQSEGRRGSWLAELREGRTVDFDGYPLTPALYDSLQQLDAVAAAASAPPCPVLLAGIGPRADATPALAALRDALTAAGCAVTLTGAVLPPFWNRVGHTDIAPLIRQTAAFCRTVETTNERI